MRQGLILFSIGLIIIAVIFVILLTIQGLQPVVNNTNTQKKEAEAKKTVNVTDVIHDPLVYDGLTVEVEAVINDWVTKKAFTLSVPSTGGLFGGRRQEQLLVIAKEPFPLPNATKGKEIGLGELVSVHVKGRVRIMSRTELGQELDIDLDGTDIKLDDNNINKWTEGSVLLVETVEKL